MAKGLCCAAASAGDLGKPLLVTVRHKDGTTSQRCGVCEVRPSCANQSKLVFAFRFLAASVCNLASGKCTPTAAHVTQYNAARSTAAASGFPADYGPSTSAANVFTAHTITARPYALPPS